MKYNANLFESIKEALNKKNSSESGFRDFMKLEIGKTYVVRLVPNLANPERTVFHYFSHLWNSVITNELVSVLCPTTYGERCPIDEYRSKIYKTQDKVAIEKIRPIKRNENWLVNVYVLKDPTNPENQGQIKILRYGKQLDKIITSAMSGDDADELGAKIFDLSEKGCNLRIKVEENEGGYPTYVASKFLSPSALEGDPNEEELYNSVKSLDTIFDHKSYDEINKLLNVHYLGNENFSQEKPISSKQQVEPEEEDSELAYVSSPSSQNEETSTKSDVEAHIEDILKDL